MLLFIHIYTTPYRYLTATRLQERWIGDNTPFTNDITIEQQRLGPPNNGSPIQSYTPTMQCSLITPRAKTSLYAVLYPRPAYPIRCSETQAIIHSLPLLYNIHYHTLLSFTHICIQKVGRVPYSNSLVRVWHPTD